MNSINQDELFAQVSKFLKSKGIDLQQGAYTRTIQKGCQVLADTINLSQQAMTQAKLEVEKTLEQVRQSIHEKTAPKTASAPPRHGSAPPRARTARKTPSTAQAPKTKPATSRKPKAS